MTYERANFFVDPQMKSKKSFPLLDETQIVGGDLLAQWGCGTH